MEMTCLDIYGNIEEVYGGLVLGNLELSSKNDSKILDH